MQCRYPYRNEAPRIFPNGERPVVIRFKDRTSIIRIYSSWSVELILKIAQNELGLPAGTWTIRRRYQGCPLGVLHAGQSLARVNEGETLEIVAALDIGEDQYPETREDVEREPYDQERDE